MQGQHSCTGTSAAVKQRDCGGQQSTLNFICLLQSQTVANERCLLFLDQPLIQCLHAQLSDRALVQRRFTQ